MRPPPASLPGRRPVVAFALLVGALSACAERDPLGLRDVARIEIATPSSELRPGAQMQVTATVYNRLNQPLDRAVHWSTRTPALIEVGSGGALRALAPGSANLRAVVGRVAAEITITQVNPPAALLDLGADSLILMLPGAAATLAPTVEDIDGLPIISAPLVWTSSAPRIAEVSPIGVVVPAAVGRTTIRATLDGITAALTLIVQPTPSGTAPLVLTVTPALVVPGQDIVITGERFGPMPAMNTVLVDGIPMNVRLASTVQLTVTLPPGGGHCLPTSPVALQVSTSGGVGAAPVTLRVAPERTLGVGESLVFETLAESACNELTTSDGRYLVAILNASRALGAGTVGVALAGRTKNWDPVVPDPEVRADALRSALEARWIPGADRMRRRLATHLELLRDTREGLVSLRLGDAVVSAGVFAGLQLPAPGGIVPVRVPDLDHADPCNTFFGVGGRAVFIGEHIVILEDTSSTVGGGPTLAGEMDALYADLGTEVEAVIWPIVSQFGNPLVMDSRLDDNGRVFLLFTPRMNGMRDGAVLGAVVNCDFYPRNQFASSNVGEVFYAQVPLNPDPGTAEGTRERWFHEMRTVIAHELKHVVGFGERIVRGRPLEELWFEEAMARLAEELYARVYSGNAQGGNAAYASGLHCDALYGTVVAGCDDVPKVMLPHFEGLWTYLDSPATHSPLGGGSETDFSFYGSAWALTRWFLDNRGVPEAQLLRDLTISDATGLLNLEARAGAGVTWNRILGQWVIALMLDDRPGLPATTAPLTFPSWNLGDVYAGLCRDLGPCDGNAPRHPLFSRALPLVAEPQGAGNFDISVPAILPGGFYVVEISGGSAEYRQLLQLQGIGGAALPTSARIAIVRIQ